LNAGKLIGSKINSEIKNTIFLATNTLFETSDLTYDALNNLDFDPHALYGNVISNHMPQTIKQATTNTQELFKKVVKETCEIIVDCSETLPTWNEGNLITQLKHPTELFEQLREILSKWQETKDKNIGEITQIEEEYRRAIARHFDQLQIFGVNFGKRARKYQLSVAYISLTTETEYNNSETTTILSSEDAITKFERLVILGEAGQGKTTLLQWLTVQCGRKSFTENKKEWNQKIPILIKLRKILNQDQFPSASDFYSIMVKNTDIKEQHKKWLYSILAKKQAIIMIDGFDEVSTLHRPKVLKWINSLCQGYVGNQIILTSRPAAYDETVEKVFAAQHFQVIKLQAMNNTAQRKFIEHWHLAVALEYDKTQPDALTSQSKALIQKLTQQNTLSNLADNPLLCAVICLLNHDRSDYLPKDKTDLYDASCRILSDSRDRAKKVFEDPKFSRLDDSSKQIFLADVAQWMSKNDQTLLSPEQLIERFTLKLSDFPGLKEMTALDLKTFFLERSGLLLKVSATEIQFAHRSFQEFFTAKHIIQEDDWITLKQNSTNSSWHETIQLAVGLCTSKAKNEKFLSSLLRQANSVKFWHNQQKEVQIYLLILRCREVMRQITPEFDRRLKNSIPKIIPPASSRMADALATAGELALPYLKRPETQTLESDFYCVQVLLKIKTPNSYQLLIDYLKPKAPKYINTICQMIETMDTNIASAAKLPQHMLNDGLNQFPFEVAVKMAFLTQDLELIPTNVVIKSIKRHVSEWDLSQGIAPLGGFRNLQNLDLNNRQINDLTSLSELNELKILNLKDSTIEDFGSIEKLTQLRSLDLRNTNIINLAPLAKLTQLQTLYLEDTQINDLRPLAALTQLRTLDLCHTSIHDLSPLAKLTQLQTLNLASTFIESISSLARLTQLQELDLERTQITDLEPLAELTQLQILDLRYTPIKDLKPLAGLVWLKAIDILGTNAKNLSHIEKHLPDCQILKE
jgi:energy-coupling factor transporter ATP-binding protein EcfA2